MKVYYEMGEQAALRGDSVDTMPKFRRADRASSWLKGHADGMYKKQLQTEYTSKDYAGLKRIRALIEAATCR